MFTRTVVPQVHPGTAWNSALYAGDTWRVGGSLRLTYGARLEAARFSGAPLHNRAVDSLFGVHTDRIPSEVHVSPRLGFSWASGDGSDGPQTTFLRGGVGDFRSLTPTALYAAALSARGLSSAQPKLICVASAVPTPDWSLYAQDPSTIPTQCTDTATAVTLTPTPSVTAFAPDFAAPRARRASLALLHRFGSSNYWVTLEGNYARGVSQYGFRDLNLVATPRFTLPNEAGRPVYVPVDSIVPTTGAVNSVGSRIHPEFGDVLLVGSDLQSDTKQLILTFTGATRWGASFRLGYTLTRARDQSSYSCCSASAGFAAPTTAGDPNAREWGTSSLERRHALVGTVTLPVTRGLEVSAIGNFMSGAPFTPIVGSDINGDGAKNDRGFIFNPPLTADTAIANGMQALLAAAPSPIRSCLRRQLGGIAARNSCTGPWQASLDLQVNWRPEWVGLDRRPGSDPAERNPATGAGPARPRHPSARQPDHHDPRIARFARLHPRPGRPVTGDRRLAGRAEPVASGVARRRRAGIRSTGQRRVGARACSGRSHARAMEQGPRCAQVSLIVVERLTEASSLIWHER